MRTALGLALLASALVAPSASAQAQSAACDWHAEFTTTLTQLGEYPSDWSVKTRLAAADGREASGLSHWDVTAEISRRTPCQLVRGVVTHEWMHLQQMRLYGVEHAARMYAAAPLVMERVADCGAELMGAPIGAYTGRDECRPGELAEARELIGDGPWKKRHGTALSATSS